MATKDADVEQLVTNIEMGTVSVRQKVHRPPRECVPLLFESGTRVGVVTNRPSELGFSGCQIAFNISVQVPLNSAHDIGQGRSVVDPHGMLGVTVAEGSHGKPQRRHS